MILAAFPSIFTVLLLGHSVTGLPVPPKPYLRRYVVECTLRDDSELRTLHSLVENDGLDVWDHDLPSKAGSMVTMMADQRLLRRIVKQFDCGRAINAQEVEKKVEKAQNDPGPDVDFFADYRSYKEITKKLQAYKGTAQLSVSLEVVGQSHEGRTIPVIRMANRLANPQKKIWLGCGQHAREWIAPASCMYLIDRFYSHFGNNERITQLLTTFEVLVAPQINPDGYEYSRDMDRFWRKNRRNNGFLRKAGVDLNRNWPNRWGLVGVSSNPNSDIYKGPSAGSEPEVAQVVKYVAGLKDLVAGVDVHSYGGLVLRSYGWATEPSPDEAILKPIGDAIAENMNAIHGMGYESQRSGELYPAAGAMDDWLYEKAHVKVGMTFEMRDKGNYGFLLPPSQIVPGGEELVEGVLTLAEQLQKLK